MICILVLLVICTNVPLLNAGSNLRISFEPFRNLTNQFLRTVQPNKYALNLSERIFFNIIDNVPVPTDPKYYVDLYWRPYIGYIILVIIGILFVIVFTLVGWFFCCCRVCCHKCGANNPNHATKNLKEKRIALNIFLFIFSSFILVGAIIAMASNFIFLETVKPLNQTNDLNGNIFYHINETGALISNYINTVSQNILVKGTNVILDAIKNGPSAFNGVLTTFVRTFTININYFRLVNTTQTFMTLYQVMQSLSTNLSSISTQHQSLSNNFSTYLNYVSSQLSAIIANENCTSNSSCGAVQEQLKGLIVGFNVSNINYSGDMEAGRIAYNYNISNLNSSLSLVISSIDNISNNANSTFLDFINSMIVQINKSNVVVNLRNFDNGSITSLLNYSNSFQQFIFSTPFGPSGATISGGYLYTYVSYAFYGLCALISLILLVVLLFYIGLCYGMCGEPSFEDASLCNKGTGSGFLMAAVWISFIFGWLIVLVTMIMFITGGLVNTEVCSYLTTNDPEKLKVVDNIVGYMVRKSAIRIGPITIPSLNYYRSVVLRCPTEPNLISAFEIPPELLQTVSNYIYSNYVEGPVNNTIASINNYNISNINTSSLDASLNSISNDTKQLQNIVSVITLNELRKSVTNLINVPAFLENMTSFANDLSKKGDNNSATNIRNMVTNLNRTIIAMDAAQTAYYNQKLKFDNSVFPLNASFIAVSTNLLIFKNSPKDAKNAAVSASETRLKFRARNIVNDTLYNFIIAFGDCKGLATSFNSAANSACGVMLVPYNNIWMGIGWFLLFIIPAIIIAVKLAAMYRISHIESEFSAYNNAYMPSNQFLSLNDLAMIRMARPQKA